MGLAQKGGHPKWVVPPILSQRKTSPKGYRGLNRTKRGSGIESSSGHALRVPERHAKIMRISPDPTPHQQAGHAIWNETASSKGYLERERGGERERDGSPASQGRVTTAMLGRSFRHHAPASGHSRHDSGSPSLPQPNNYLCRVPARLLVKSLGFGRNLSHGTALQDRFDLHIPDRTWALRPQRANDDEACGALTTCKCQRYRALRHLPALLAECRQMANGNATCPAKQQPLLQTGHLLCEVRTARQSL